MEAARVYFGTPQESRGFQTTGFPSQLISAFIILMKDQLNSLSQAARDVFQSLSGQPKPLPDLQDMDAHRERTRMGYQPYIDEALQDFDGDLETINLGGIRCLQITPSGWDVESGICIQYAYGGGYIAGSPEEDLIVTAPRAGLSGARFICVDYRLSPEFQYPLPQQDMMTVFQNLITEYPIERLALVGESAGGNQVLGLLARIRQQDLPMPFCAVMLSPWIDLSYQGDSHVFNAGRDPSLSTDYLELIAAAHAGDTPRDDPGMSPLFADLRGLPPVMLTTGTRDLLLSQAVMLSRRLQENGVEVELQIWDDLWHVFEFYPIPEKMESLQLVASFTTRHAA